MGAEMSDKVLLGFMKPVKPEEVAGKSGRGPSNFWPRMAELFVDSGQAMMEIDYKAMGRKWAAVAQSLRLALKDTPLKSGNGEMLSSVAYVSVNKGDETIYLRRRESAEPVKAGRPKGSTRKK
jgi:hypothetical protein